MTGNKGSVGIRFNFNDTSFAFINLHLDGGLDNVKHRLESIKEIYNNNIKYFSEEANPNV